MPLRKIKGGGESGGRGPVEILSRVDFCENLSKDLQ